MSHAQRSAVKVLRRMQYFVARRKFQVRKRKSRGERKFYKVKESKGGGDTEIKRETD